MTPVQGAKSRRAGVSGVTALRGKFFGRQTACRPLRTSHARDRYDAKKYTNAMTAANMAPNQTKVWVMLFWVWVSVVVVSALPSWAGAAGLQFPGLW